jgi:hypothetical protein
MNRPGYRASNSAVKTTQLLTTVILAIGLNQFNPAQAQTPADSSNDAKPAEASKKVEPAPPTPPASQKPLPTDPEERFKLLFTKASLAGRWAPLKDGVLGEERGGDNYHIVSVAKVEGDGWIVSAKMKYRNQEIVIPIPVQMKFHGDTAILTVDNLMAPGGGTYAARLLIYERTYSGNWKGQRGGGMLYGTIVNEAE